MAIITIIMIYDIIVDEISSSCAALSDRANTVAPIQSRPSLLHTVNNHDL